MTEPLDMMEGDEDNSPTINLIELFDESDSEDESEDIDVGEELNDLLTLTTKGPQLDERTVVMLFNNGVEDS